jgi:hypothetical protein
VPLKVNFFSQGVFFLFQKNELEVELLKLKQSVNEDEADPISVSSSSLRDTSRGKTW